MLPEGWTTKPLEALTYRPISYGVLKPGDFDPEGVPMIRIQDAKNGYKVSDLWMISRSLSDEYKRTIVREGDIIFSVVGTLGECKKIDAALAGANVSRAFAVLGLDQSVSTDFVFQFLISDKTLDWVAQTGRGGAQKVVNLGDLKALEIPLPPLPEQRRIAQVLGSVDATIETTKAIIEQTKTVKQGLLQTLLTRGIGHTEFKDSPLGEIPAVWEVKTFESLVASMAGGVSVNSEDRPHGVNEIGILKTSAVSAGAFYPEKNKTILPDEISRSKTNPLKGSIIFSRMNTPELVGESAYVKEDYPDLYLPDRLWLIRVCEKAGVSALWLSQLMASKSFRSRLGEIATGTSGSMKNISKAKLNAMLIAVPPVQEQQVLICAEN